MIRTFADGRPMADPTTFRDGRCACGAFATWTRKEWTPRPGLVVYLAAIKCAKCGAGYIAPAIEPVQMTLAERIADEARRPTRCGPVWPL